jgi:hypothetical protein
VVNESMRAALIYRFGPDMSGQSVARDIEQFTTAPGLYDNSWAGFYIGGGVTQNTSTVLLPGAGSISITDNLGETLTNRRFDLSRSGDTQASFNLFMGYRVQLNRFLIGIERSFESSSFSTIDPRGVGTFGSQSAPLICYPFFSGALPCVGQSMTNAGFTTTGHLRLTGGVVVTPDAMAFVSGGYAYGVMPGFRISTGGIVSSFPSTPLSGAATVGPSAPVNVRGRTIGGGFELKAAPGLFVRAEYHHDWYEFNPNGPTGAGYGGTIGNVTTNSFVRGDGIMRVTNDSFKLSMIYRFWNPQNPSGIFTGQYVQ